MVLIACHQIYDTNNDKLVSGFNANILGRDSLSVFF